MKRMYYACNLSGNHVATRPGGSATLQKLQVVCEMQEQEGRRKGRGGVDSNIVLLVFAMIGLVMLILAVSTCPPITTPIVAVCEPALSLVHTSHCRILTFHHPMAGTIAGVDEECQARPLGSSTAGTPSLPLSDTTTRLAW
jgi:hypothetical protein